MKRVRHPDIAELTGPVQTSQSDGVPSVILFRSPGFRALSKGAQTLQITHCRELTLNVVAT